METVAIFLTELGASLKALDGVDIDLADIVSSHLLTATPESGCVDEALSAITALAEHRASPLKKEGPDA